MYVLRFWGLVAVLYGLVAVVLSASGAPAPYLLAGVIAGGICAVTTAAPQKLPGRARELALGVVGLEAGSHVDGDVLGQVAANPVAVVGSAVATLLVTLALGQLLRFSPHVAASTATFASIAGGASGITAMAKELGADAPTVVSVQYLRVLVVVSSVPVIAPLLGGIGPGQQATNAALLPSVLFVGTALAGGLALARIWNFTASKIIFPMLVASVLSVLDLFPGAEVPLPVSALGLALIGLMVGLDLTRGTMRHVSRILPLASVTLILGLVSCAGIGIVFAHVTGVSFYSAYLATTPGGLPAIMAFALTAGDDIGLVVACQVLRVFLAISLGAVVASWIKRNLPERDPPADSQ